ncbi:peroxidase family protein [Cribrihabitans pelagius]|uniref:peroxidase family protein n=1 Tax=Cribrihabitans pelagius TaxID=1765746 RepID=UPI003B5C2F21
MSKILYAAKRPDDGYASNPENPDWGAAGTALLHLASSELGPDGEMSGADRPSPREISNLIAVQQGEPGNAAGLSDFLWIWGQFLDHDLSLTEAGRGVTADIPVPAGDPYFDPFGSGDAVINFFRADRQDGAYVNQITGFMDASMIYGSDAAKLESMRIDGGRMKMTADGYLYLEEGALLTGDVRAAENTALSSMHTIFTREHNRQVDLLAERMPHLSEDALFDAARARVEAVIQAITYKEFLPLLIGQDALPDYRGYDATVNPGISAEFSTVVFRLGHTLLSANLHRVAEDGTALDPLALRDAFFQPHLLSGKHMIDDVMRGAADQQSQAIDTQVVEDVRSFLFGPPGAGGFDLAALNIQRGRDMGVASYNNLREAMGLARAEHFSDITSDAELAARLEALYGGTDLVDAWVGGLAEDPTGGGLLGETFTAVMVDQFSRLRDGDPYWSASRGSLAAEERAALWETTLADVLLNNTGIEAIQKDVFIAMNRIGGSGFQDVLKGTGDADFIFGGEARDYLFGRAGNDDLQGGAGNDVLKGNRGADCLDGGWGNDLLRGGRGDDFVFGGEGRDMLYGLGGNDTLKGGAGNDVLHGHRGDDLLEGGEGDDVITGGPGDNTLQGGAGHDVFLFKTHQPGANRVTDYETGADQIRLHSRNPAGLEVTESRHGVSIANGDGWSLLVEGISLAELEMQGVSLLW